MRTTLTLDDDVYKKLEAERHRTGRSFKEVVNERLRLALIASRKEAPRREFRVDAKDMGLRPGVDLSNIEQLLDQLDGPVRR